MILAGTGYRPDKLPNKETGYIIPNPTFNFVCKEIKKNLLLYKPEKVISGMSQGFDLYLAFVAVKLNIPFVAAVPFKGQETMWPTKSQEVYKKLLNKASDVVIVSPGSYSAYKMQTRNRYLVDNCDLLLACIKPSETSGGTFNCVNYAKYINRNIVYINPGNII
jgi:uncharacterized phage-like protein YoqJ